MRSQNVTASKDADCDLKRTGHNLLQVLRSQIVILELEDANCDIKINLTSNQAYEIDNYSTENF
jgi:hypothetical protein